MSLPSPTELPARWAAPPSTARDRRPIVVAGGHDAPGAFQLIGRTTALVLGVALAVAFGLRLLALAATPVGWLVTGAAALLALVIPWTLHGRRRRSDRLLVLDDLPPRWATRVATAADQVQRLCRLADRAPAGPVADHLTRLAYTAHGHLLLLRDAASQASGPLADDAALAADIRRVADELSALACAAERLLAAQQRQLEPSPLAELTAQTDRFAASLEASSGAGYVVDDAVGDGYDLPPPAGFR